MTFFASLLCPISLHFFRHVHELYEKCVIDSVSKAMVASYFLNLVPSFMLAKGRDKVDGFL